MKSVIQHTSDDVLVATEDGDRYVRPANVPDVHTEVQQLCTAWQVKRPVRTPLDTSCWRYWLHGEQRRVYVTLISAWVKHLHIHHDHCHYPSQHYTQVSWQNGKTYHQNSFTDSKLHHMSFLWKLNGAAEFWQRIYNSGVTYANRNGTEKNLIPLTKSTTKPLRKMEKFKTKTNKFGYPLHFHFRLWTEQFLNWRTSLFVFTVHVVIVKLLPEHLMTVNSLFINNCSWDQKIKIWASVLVRRLA